MGILITTAEATLAATLNDSAAARDFAAMLPLTLTLSDFHGTEKIADLPGTLRTTGSTSGTAAEPETSPTTRPGATSRSSTATSATPTA